MKKLLAVCICLFGIFVSCRKEEPVINVSQSSIEAESAGGTFTIQVVSNVEWTQLCGESWIKIKRESDNSSITITVVKNSDPDGRTGHITLSSPDVSTVITVNQKQQNMIVLEGENQINILDGESSFSVDTQVNTDFKVEISRDAGWLMVVGGTKAMTPKAITFHADANPAHETRTAEVYLKADKCEPVLVKITQMGRPYYFEATLSGISRFAVPAIFNNNHPAKVLYNGMESEYFKGMIVDFSSSESNEVGIKVYQLVKVTFNDIVGVDKLDFSGM